ncbi:MAG: flagellar hook-length control protein FliK, partial [Lachnospiraceae bacterium]|nr:flagellar hook-length control protein FliK [Lachnospiraceae bacterium]
MKSANITSLPGMGDMGIAPQRTVAKQDDENKPVDFKMLMHRSITVAGQNVNTSRGNAASDPQVVSDKKASSSFESPKQDNNFINKADNAKPIAEDTTENVKETFGEIEDAVKATVAEELGITEDELDEAMEVLGLAYIDLFDPANLQMLLGQVAQDMPEIAVDVAAIDPAELIGQLEAAVVPVLEEAQLKPEETDLLLSGFVPMDEPEVAKAFAGILEQVSVPEEMTGTTETPETMAQPAKLPNGFTPVRPEREKGADVRVIEVIDEEPEAVSVPEEQPEEAVTANPAVQQEQGKNAAPTTTESVTVETTIDPETQTKTTTVTVEVTESFTEEQSFSEEPRDEAGADIGSRTETRMNAGDILTAAANVQQNFAEAVAQAQAQTREAVMPYTSVDARDVIDQIVTNAQATITEEVTRMEIELNPQTLGRMIMQVQSDSDGVVTAKLVAQNEAVREALETQMQLLRENMNNRGIRVEAVEVTVGTHEFEQALEEGQQQTGQYEEEQRREQEAAQGRRMRNLNTAELDDMQGLLTEEEELAA